MDRRTAVRVGVGMVLGAWATPAGAVDPPAPLVVPAAVAPAAPPEPPVAVVTPSAAADGPDAFPRMLAESKAAVARLRDYATHYIRQERVSGKLVPEQTCELRVRASPPGVALTVTGPREYAGRETVYVAGRAGGTVRFKDAGRPAVLTLPVDHPRVLADTRHAITDVGLAAVLARVENAVVLERRLGNPVQVLAADYQFAGRKCRRFEAFCDRPHPHRYAHRHVLLVDADTHLPVRYEAYDQPRVGGPDGGELIEVQSFVGLKANVGLGESAFAR